MENVKSKYESRNTFVRAKGIYGKVHCSIAYCDDEPSTISFSQHRKGFNGEQEYHSISLYKDDLKALVDMLKENEMI